jgi:membrane associated rhomboid family serine protease
VIPLRDANPTHGRPLVTVGLVAACIAVFGVELLVGATAGDVGLERFFRTFGVVPAELTGQAPASSAIPPLATLVTYLFVHAGWLHLAGNMLYLWIFGNNVEDRLGHVGYLLVFLAGGLIAALAQVAIDPAGEAPLIGASGAISTVLGVYVVLFPRARVVSLVFLVFVYQLMEVPAAVLLGFWFVLQLLDGLLAVGADTGPGGVAIFAHIGGFVAGLGIGALVRWRGTARAAAV